MTPFFAALNIFYVWPRLIREKVATINRLRKDDAVRAKNIIEGLMISSQENVDIANIQKTNARQKCLNYWKNTRNGLEMK